VRTLQIELPDQIASEVDEAIRSGRFVNVSEVVRVALAEFLSQHRFELMERQQLADIAWAVREKPAQS
jgi:Arc/MetJ-type ribon-helix-helix transcriptional regulator